MGRRNPSGAILISDILLKDVQLGDLVLCAGNAVAISLAFTAYRESKPVAISAFPSFKIV
jgi:hypothetical protein